MKNLPRIALMALAPCFAIAASWNTGTWPSTSAPSAAAEADNLARATATTCQVTGNNVASSVSSLSNFGVTHDGAISASTAAAGSYALGDNAVVTYSFGGSALVSSVNIYTYWSDNGRNGLGISSIDVSADGETWTSVSDSNLPFTGNPTSTKKIGLSAIFSNGDGTAFATGIVALRICCGTMHNNGTGIVEIEVVGEVSQASTYTVTFYDASGNVLKTLSDVAAGSDVSSDAPAAPVIPGQIFAGWDVDLTSVTTDLDATATYVAANAAVWSVETWSAATNIADLLTVPGATLSIVTNSTKALTEAATITTDTSVAALHDGSLPRTKSNSTVYAIGDGAVVQCDFATPVDLSSLGFWTYYSGGGGRDGIAVESIEARRGARGAFHTIAAMTPFEYGTKKIDGNDASPGSFHAMVSRADGSLLAEHVSAVRIVFGDADNGWSVYTEIEAVGTPLPVFDATVILVR